MQLIKIIGVTLLSFTLLDALWLGAIAPNLYQRHIGFLMAEAPNWIAVMIFYVLFNLLFIYFVVWPGLGGSAQKVLSSGALFGLATYGTYELTNKAVIENWPWAIVPIDIAWGMVLCSLSAWVGWYVGKAGRS